MLQRPRATLGDSSKTRTASPNSKHRLTPHLTSYTPPTLQHHFSTRLRFQPFKRQRGGWGGGRSRAPNLCKPSLNDFVFFAFTPYSDFVWLLHLVCWRRSFYSFIRFTKETLFRFALVSCFFTPPRIRLAFAFLSVGEDVSFMSIYFFAFNPLKRFRLAFSKT